MRKAALDAVYELAKKDRRIFFIGSDLGAGTLQSFKDEMPERFLMEGVSEANIVGIAAGLALEGKIPYVNTIASFLTRRCFEQVVIDLCLHNVNVRLLGNGGGLVYAPLGPTHEAIEDLAILRAIPNMTIICPADAAETRRLMPLTVDYQGPMYIRLAKGNEPIVTTDEIPFRIGKVFQVCAGEDAAIVTTGITLRLGLEAAHALEKKGMKVGVIHVPTIKPIDRFAIIDCIRHTPIVVTIEEHVVTGGLGSAVAEIIMEANLNVAKRFKRIGIPDVFAEKYGSQASLMDEFGIAKENLIAVVQNLSDKVLV